MNMLRLTRCYGSQYFILFLLLTLDMLGIGEEDKLLLFHVFKRPLALSGLGSFDLL